MSMKATDDVVRRSATFRATVDLPDPEPPAIPIIRGFIIVTKTTRAETGTHYAFFVYDSAYCNTSETPMKSRLIPFALALSGLTACNGFRHPTPADADVPTIIEVDNQGFLDMTVYAQRSSQRIRLGI